MYATSTVWSVLFLFRKGCRVGHTWESLLIATKWNLYPSVASPNTVQSHCQIHFLIRWIIPILLAPQHSNRPRPNLLIIPSTSSRLPSPLSTAARLNVPSSRPSRNTWSHFPTKRIISFPYIAFTPISRLDPTLSTFCKTSCESYCRSDSRAWFRVSPMIVLRRSIARKLPRNRKRVIGSWDFRIRSESLVRVCYSR